MNILLKPHSKNSKPTSNHKTKCRNYGIEHQIVIKNVTNILKVITVELVEITKSFILHAKE